MLPGDCHRWAFITLPGVARLRSRAVFLCLLLPFSACDVPLRLFLFPVLFYLRVFSVLVLSFTLFISSFVIILLLSLLFFMPVMFPSVFFSIVSLLHFYCYPNFWETIISFTYISQVFLLCSRGFVARMPVFLVFSLCFLTCLFHLIWCFLSSLSYLFNNCFSF